MQVEEGTSAPTDAGATPEAAPAFPPPVTSTLCEVEMYAYLLVATLLVDQKKFQQVGWLVI